MWLVEVRPVRIDDSRWAPLFSAVVEPNTFTKSVETAKNAEPRPNTDEQFLARFMDPDLRAAAAQVLAGWADAGHGRYFGRRGHAVLTARGPSENGRRSVLNIYSDGRVLVPFWAYAGRRTDVPIAALMTEDFGAATITLLGLAGSEGQGRTAAGWLTPARVPALLQFSLDVARAYAEYEPTFT